MISRRSLGFFLCLFLFMFSLSCPATPPHPIQFSGNLRLVYVVPADRQPHAQYRERFDFFFRLVQDYFRRQMGAAGYFNAQGKGKTFALETENDGLFKVHLIDHRPEGNHPDPTKTHAFYQKEPYSIDTEIAHYLGLNISDNAVVIRLTDMSWINGNHGLELAPNAGLGDEQAGSVYSADHILGNDISYKNRTNGPIAFDTIGLSRDEQIRIFNDTRMTNIDGGGPCARTGPLSWRSGEWPDQRNSQVWEYASVFLGAIIHEIGHGFGLFHTFVYTPSKTGKFQGDFQLMGNGFRGIFSSLIPGVRYSPDEHYANQRDVLNRNEGFGSPIIIHAGQLANLNRHKLFNPDRPTGETVRPVVDHLEITWAGGTSAPGVTEDSSADFPVGTERFTARFKIKDPSAEGEASGLSHINLVVDGNHRMYQSIPEKEAQENYSGAFLHRPNPGEDPALLYRPGMHAVTLEVVDRDGNHSEGEASTRFFTIDEPRIGSWLIWERWFDAEGTDRAAMLEYPYFGIPDADLAPLTGVTPKPGWRLFHTGPYVSLNGYAPIFFTSRETRPERVCYAATVIDATGAGHYQLRLGNDDFAQVFLNGKEVLREDATGNPHPPFDASLFHHIPVDLKAGRNLLVIKILDVMGGSGFHAGFEDEGGKPIALRCGL